MIIYDLSCDNDHRFEGWFRSPDDFEAQNARQFIRCPQCDSAKVRRIPSAVAIGGHAEEREVPTESRSASTVSTVSTAMVPANSQVAAAYQALVDAIVESAEDVGSSFAEEARRIHYNEAPERSIRGQATSDEREALLDEGIDIFQLPVIRNKH